MEKNSRIQVEEKVSGRLWLIHNALTEEECAEYIKRTEKIGYDEAKTFQHMYRNRDNDRCMVDDKELAGKIYKRLVKVIPDQMPKGWKKYGLNERWRFCRYEKGQHFGAHVDGDFARSYTERSFLTLMFYLNSSKQVDPINGQFNGGSTRFFKMSYYNTLYRGSNNNTNIESKDIEFAIKPEAGLAVMFMQGVNGRLLHDGEEVTDGLKYIMRTDIMYCSGSGSDDYNNINAEEEEEVISIPAGY